MTGGGQPVVRRSRRYGLTDRSGSSTYLEVSPVSGSRYRHAGCELPGAGGRGSGYRRLGGDQRSGPGWSLDRVVHPAVNLNHWQPSGGSTTTPPGPHGCQRKRTPPGWIPDKALCGSSSRTRQPASRRLLGGPSTICSRSHQTDHSGAAPGAASPNGRSLWRLVPSARVAYMTGSPGPRIRPPAPSASRGARRCPTSASNIGGAWLPGRQEVPPMTRAIDR